MRFELRSSSLAIPLVAGLAATIVSCGPSARTDPSVATTPPASSPTPSSSADQQICQAYAKAAPSARTPLDAMRTQAVLVPFITLIELNTNQVAARAGDANSPAVAGAMRELVAAQEDIDAQGHRALRTEAELTETPVRLDPTRLAAALDAADQACQPVLAR